MSPNGRDGPIDPVALAAELIRCPSVTPEEAGALDLLERVLRPLGFACHRLVFESPGTEPVDNLFARLGDGAPHLCFAGHTDVVPPGDPGAWSHDPFSGAIEDGQLWGRGAADMKGAIAAFVAAVSERLTEAGACSSGSVSLLITGDEEGPSVNGTARVLDWMEEHGHVPDLCIVGEPTNQVTLGDMAKIGRRGSFTGTLTVRGVQGHTAYPHLADNPIHRLVRMLEPFTGGVLDEGSAHFPPTTLMLTTIDVGNPATNVIPAMARAVFNVRFNDLHSSDSLAAMLQRSFDREGADYDFAWSCSGESFLTEPGALSELICAAVEAVAGRRPELSTTGGTSDARFIRRLCPVIEFGLIGRTMHKVDERVTLDSLRGLHQVYLEVLRRALP